MNTFTVLAEPNRRKLLDALVHGPKSVTDLVQDIGMSQPVVSKHLRVLRDAHLVSATPDGQRRLYRLNPEPLSELDEWLTPYRALWADRLDALEHHLRSEHDRQ
jgi:DNA-binding transcriptional ArsR family regulator